MNRFLRQFGVSVLAIVLILGFAHATFVAPVVNEQFRFQPDDPGGDDEFGSNVAIEGNTTVIGAANSGGGLGAAYIFQRRGNSWVQQAKLIASAPSFDSEFGETVAISGDTVVIGAPSDASAAGFTGAAYVFKRVGDSWNLQAKLVADDAADGDFFSGGIAISGDVVVAGAESASSSAGAAYVFTRVGEVWTQQAKLIAGDANSAFFGASVAIAANRLIVGAPGGTGAAYVFEQQGQKWTERAKLVSSDGTNNGGFGSGVGISGNTVVIGAFFQDTTEAVAAGAAYVFERAGTGWAEAAKLSASDGASGNLFGVQLAISGSTIAIGASAFGNPSIGGSAYIFERQSNSWIEAKKLLPSDGAPLDGFGAYIAADSNSVLVGGELSKGEGAAYLFSVRGALP